MGLCLLDTTTASQIVDLIGTFLIKLAGEREGGRVLLCIPKVQAALVLPVADYSKREVGHIRLCV